MGINGVAVPTCLVIRGVVAATGGTGVSEARTASTSGGAGVGARSGLCEPHAPITIIKKASGKSRARIFFKLFPSAGCESQ